MAWVRGWIVLILMSGACLTASAQQAGRRVALVIGNSAYASQGTLANPGPDSRLVADALRRVGFTVTAMTDQSKSGMERSLRDFSRQADGAEVALVYYAGHSLEANGVNWLLPVDATLADERDLSFEAINLDTVLGTVERARGLRMVVLDACRNNPFTGSMRRSASSTRAVTRGLADVEVTGTLVLYSARGGFLAQDGPAGGNSPFAAALARRIPEPGVDIRLLVSKVRDDVLVATGRGQEPFSYGSLPGVFLSLGPGPARSGAGDLGAALVGRDGYLRNCIAHETPGRGALYATQWCEDQWRRASALGGGQAQSMTQATELLAAKDAYLDSCIARMTPPLGTLAAAQRCERNWEVNVLTGNGQAKK